MASGVQEHTTLWGLTAEGWVAVGTLGLFVATIALAGVTLFLVRVAREEVKEARDEARRSRTLAAVEQYFHDPVLHAALRNMAHARDISELHANPHKYRVDIFVLMNYFETIALGIRQELYIEGLVRDFLEPILEQHLHEFIDEKLLQKLNIDSSEFPHSISLHTRWSDPKIHYKGDKP